MLKKNKIIKKRIIKRWLMPSLALTIYGNMIIDLRQIMEINWVNIIFFKIILF
jgi:hypothetical protein